MSKREEACPCGHEWEEHNTVVGCVAGWEHDAEGLATAAGCCCKLAHTEVSAREW